MKKYLAVCLGSPASMSKWQALEEKERTSLVAKGFQEWAAWGERNAKAIVDNGAPLGKTKRVDKNGISDVKNDMTAFIVVEAESHEAAAKIFLNHPHFTVFPGQAVEVMEFMDIPKN